MTINGTIISIFPETSGVSKDGKAWRRRDYIVAYDNSNPEYPLTIAISVFGDNIDSFNLRQGVLYELNIFFIVRDHQGKACMNCWYAEAKEALAPACQLTK